MKTKKLQKNYYQLAAESSSRLTGHAGLLRLKKHCLHSKNILDLGCGEGTRLNALLSPKQRGTGVDISGYAINLAKKKYPRHHFLSYNGKKLPFKKGTFDLVYSAFVLEHTTDPTTFVLEAIRVLKQGGRLVLLCPNFGAPNRRSPNSVQNPITKLLQGFVADFSKPSSSLDWTFVNPKKTYDQSDDDTTVEPYLNSLKSFIYDQGLDMAHASSLWSLEMPSLSPRKLLFRLLGQLGIYPFTNWGPQLYLEAIKR